MRSQMPRLSTGFLERERIDAAYPLVQLHRPDASLSTWRSFAKERICGNDLNGRLGFLYVEDQVRTILGLAECAWSFDLLAKKMLRVDSLMISGVLSCQERATAAALMRAIEKLASEEGCNGVELHIPTARNISQALRDIEQGSDENAEWCHQPRGQLTHYTYRRIIS